jgi:hypothetical protein
MLDIRHPHTISFAGRVAHVVAEPRRFAADITFAGQLRFTPFTNRFFCCIIYHEIDPDPLWSEGHRVNSLTYFAAFRKLDQSCGLLSG